MYLHLILASRYCRESYFGQIHLIGSSVNLSPLVYELKKESGLSEFIEACKHVLRSIKPNPEVSESFVSYTWLKHIKVSNTYIAVN